jgi:diguanylate cyclase
LTDADELHTLISKIMDLALLGTLVQTVGAILLALTFFYLSRGSGSRVLKAAAFGWLFLFLSLGSLFAAMRRDFPYELFPYQYFPAALPRGSRHRRRPHRPRLPDRKTAAVGRRARAARVVLAGLARGSGALFQTLHMGIGAIGWFAITILILRSRARGLGRQFSALLASGTAIAHVAYVVLFAISAQQADRPVFLIAFIGFVDLFLEMLFGIGLIIWAMEDTEAELALVHARTVGETQRTKRRAQLDPLTEAHNRFFLEEIRPQLTQEQSSGSIVLIDVDGLKTINDTEGHEEGDKAIWTIATAIKKLVRGNDFLIRWGGDEFLVILPSMDEGVAKKRFYMLPARIDEVRQAPNLPRSYRKFLTASVGVTPFSARVPFDVAIEQADRVMYERKKALKEMRGVRSRRNGEA